MQPIIEPVARELLEAELTPDKYIRPTNFGNRAIYITNIHQSPNVVREIGRLREVSFRSSGGGTGLELDLDEYDTSAEPFQQLVVWCPESREIVGGYRFIEGSKIHQNPKGEWESPSAHLFQYHDVFTQQYMPKSVELGRSFIQPTFQSGNMRGGIYSLDNLWDGLGAIISTMPHIEYFFGKVTMYPSFNNKARDLILYFMSKYFPDKEGLMTPFVPLSLTTSDAELEEIFVGGNYREDYKIMSKLVKIHGEHIPPLVNAYMNLSPTMKSFGTAINEPFGRVEETGIMLKIADIYEEKRQRHLLIRNQEE